MEEYKYRIGKSLAWEEQYSEGELVWSQGMTIENMLDVFIIDLLDNLSENN
tara:strand:+ start:3660 stop:3812 length:153 start_codon:yes stop_codon:yes gene_type:complete